MTDYDKARQTMLDKYGGEEGLRKHYQDMQRKAMQHPNNAKGTAKSGYNNKEVARAAGAKGRAKRYGKSQK